jgi:hypothetical protein
MIDSELPGMDIGTGAAKVGLSTYLGLTKPPSHRA